MANDKRDIKIHEITKVTPVANSTPSPPSSLSLPLTYFDTVWLKFHPVERLFFYHVNDLNPNIFYTEILPDLKHSLSLALLHYLPLAGNLLWPEDTAKPAVYYNFPNSEDGVSVTVAESDADFNHLSGNGIRENVEFHPLIPPLVISDDKAEVISIQITLFPNQGFSIGISCHHAVLDGKTSTMFIKSWAYLCKQLQLGQEQNFFSCLSPELTPFFDRTVIRDPDGRDMVELNKWFDNAWSEDSNPTKRSLKVMPIPISVDADNLVRATFELTRDDIKKLRNQLLHETSQSSNSKQLHLSTFVVTLAYVVVCMVKAKADEGKKYVILGFTADYRSRLHPPVPNSYFGNCVGIQVETTKASGVMQANGFAFAAEILSDLVKAINVSEELQLDKFLEIMKHGALIISVAGSNRFDVYGSDFGWGRPKKVEIVSIDRTEAISLAESRDEGGGVEIGVVLKKQQVEVFASSFTDGLKMNFV